MIISYCVNPNCSSPKNHPKLRTCYNCGWNLILNNRYRVIKKIGQGGFGATFIGVDLTQKDNPLCVVKQLRPSTDDPDGLKMALDLFQREAQTLGKINHPNIPKLLNYFVDNQEFYLIQELVKGYNLKYEVKQHGVFSEAKLRTFLREMLPVIQYIHSQKVIHRDIKPANILRRQKDDQLILIDFGAVKDQVNTQLANTYGQTAYTKFSVGTMGYAAPEQMAMRPIYASDIYALGATCVYLLSGESPKNLQRNQQTGKLIWKPEIEVSSDLTELIEKMLESDVRSRYRSAEQVMEALEKIQVSPGSLNQGVVNFSKTDRQIIESLPSSEITTKTSATSATQKLQQELQKRRTTAKSPNSSEILDQQTFIMYYQNGEKDFRNQNLRELKLEEMELGGYIFLYSNFESVSLRGANLAKANCFGANFRNAILQNANLQKTNLSQANLENADLRGADLTGANLSGADLTGANLIGANLKTATVKSQQLKNAKTNWTTIFPDGGRVLWKLF
jgi:serine/threonine-protein kinase